MEHMELMFEDMDRMLKKLKKSSYQEYSEEFTSRHGHFFEEMTSYVKEGESKEARAEEIGLKLTRDVREAFASRRGRINSGVQANLNLFMIFYVFPTLLKSGDEDARLIADALCEAWAREFKGNNIQYTDYDTLYNSFRNKIFGLF